jgi:endonuclease-3
MDMNKAEKICAKLAETFPNPKTELQSESDYMFLVAVVLSAQSTDIQVNRVTAELFKKYDTPDRIIALGLDGLRSAIKSIGLYKRKAAHILELSKILLQEHAGVIPRDRNQLMALPGVGRKTANVILNVLFDQPAIAVDTHVLRVSGRLGLSTDKNPLIVEKDLENIIPDHYKKSIGHLLILHGRYVCRARAPSCGSCCLAELCPALHSARLNIHGIG